MKWHKQILWIIIFIFLLNSSYAARNVFYDGFDTGTSTDKGWSATLNTMTESGSEIYSSSTSSAQISQKFTNISFRDVSWKIDIGSRKTANGVDYTTFVLGSDTNWGPTNGLQINFNQNGGGGADMNTYFYGTCTGSSFRKAYSYDTKVYAYQIYYNKSLNKFFVYRNASLYYNFTMGGCNFTGYYVSLHSRSSNSKIRDINITDLSYTVSNSCTCTAFPNNWRINKADNCKVNTNCYSGNISTYGTGNKVYINATVMAAKRIENLSDYEIGPKGNFGIKG